LSALAASIARRGEGEALAARIVGCLPAATFEMETFVSLAGVVASREVPSAAVSCAGRPTLLLNPDFVAAHCTRDEHLFLLVMHELWHVMLAHTRLYPRATPAENVAFDAVINAGLARRFPGPEYRGFFRALNPADAFPGCLLRPPAGWPDAPRIPRRATWPRGTRELIARLYPRERERGVPAPLYAEILALLKAAEQDAEPLLIGDHGDPDAESALVDGTEFGEVLRRSVADWPPLGPGARGLGGEVGDWLATLGPPTSDARRVFATVLRRTLVPHRSGERQARRGWVRRPSGVAPLPNPRDRQAPARRALGVPDLLQVQALLVRQRAPEPPARAHVYLDVSGSMFTLLPDLLGLLLPHVAAGRAAVFQFSTEVEPLPLADLRAGRLRSTGGTHVDCVLAHALATPRLRTVLLVTDGYVGAPGAGLLAGVQRRAFRIHAVLPEASAGTEDLEGVARSITVLPPT
jgi:hypothetical protein